MKDQKTDKKIKIPPTKDPLKYNRNRIILDTILFLIIIITISFSLIFISSLPKDRGEYYKNFDSSGEYFEDVMQSYLKSTIPNVEYIDNSGTKTEFLGSTVEQLILVDLGIRNGASDNLNETSLEQGLEHEIGTLLDTIFKRDQNFILTANLETSKGQNSENSGQNSTIMITNSETPPNLDLKTSPDFEKHLRFDTSTKNNPENSEAVIRLYLI